ncbi:MAG: hypothetical protein ETSY2_25960 [Candidatus Entotheonella gemina]|uniref:Glycosyltransferase 2-like domain-containing protein n=1 Tax=Candidatus Entotheonella gemina TaxID=1429439 RepID=W4M429_9BACT|nr:MAG: hypothetical protein ETSY2_25960 [Candidatus Entotheonella gemina]
MPFDTILVNVPYQLKRTGEPYEIPGWLPHQPKVRIHRCTDYGPATKLFGALEVVTEPDCVIITVDDDVRYPPVMVETYKRYYERYGERVYCTAGFDITDPVAFAYSFAPQACSKVWHDLSEVQIAEGFGSVAYMRKFFSDDIFEIEALPGFVVYSDDLYISNYLSGKGVKKTLAATEAFGGAGYWVRKMLPYSENADALHHNKVVGTNGRRYYQTIRYLLENNMYYFA